MSTNDVKFENCKYEISPVDMLVNSFEVFGMIYDCIQKGHYDEALLHSGAMESRIKSYLIDIGEYVKRNKQDE